MLIILAKRSNSGIKVERLGTMYIVFLSLMTSKVMWTVLLKVSLTESRHSRWCCWCVAEAENGNHWHQSPEPTLSHSLYPHMLWPTSAYPSACLQLAFTISFGHTSAWLQLWPGATNVTSLIWDQLKMWPAVAWNILDYYRPEWTALEIVVTQRIHTKATHRGQ